MCINILFIDRMHIIHMHINIIGSVGRFASNAPSTGVILDISGNIGH